jgi:molybdate transport system substrate-binding protein
MIPMIEAMMARIWVLLLMLFGCSSERPVLTVSAAVSLKEALTEIAAGFSGAEVNLQFAASGELEKQITGGATIDVFFSASNEQIDRLTATQRLDASTKKNIASNELILVTYKGSGVSASDVAGVIAHPKVTHIAIGEVALVPAGAYAKKAFSALNLWENVSAKMVTGTNVRQVLDLVGRKEAELGVVYQTDIRNRDDVFKLFTLSVEPPISYPAAVTTSSTYPAEAKAFLDFVAGEAGQKVLAKYGFKEVRNQ